MEIRNAAPSQRRMRMRANVRVQRYFKEIHYKYKGNIDNMIIETKRDIAKITLLNESEIRDDAKLRRDL